MHRYAWLSLTSFLAVVSACEVGSLDGPATPMRQARCGLGFFSDRYPTECQEALDDFCCSELRACADDADCVRLVDCVNACEGSRSDECIDACAGGQDAPPGYAALETIATCAGGRLPTTACNWPR